MRRVVIGVLIAMVVWACARPASQRTADAQPGATQPSRARPALRPTHPNPCEAARRDGELTPLDAKGRPKAQPGAEEPISFRVASTRHVAIGREIDHAELWYLAHPRGGCFEVFVDGRLRGRVSTRTLPPPPKRPRRRPTPRPAPALERMVRYTIPSPPLANGAAVPRTAATRFESRRIRLKRGGHRLEVRPVGKGTVRFFGWLLERNRPGVVVHNLGVTGVQAANLLPGQMGLIDKQYQRIDPTLVIVHVGTNDAYDSRLTEARFEKRLTRLLKRLRPAPSPPDCIVVGAPDFGDKRWRKARRLRKQAAMVRRVQRKVAVANRCAYWDQYAAMGGRGAIQRFMRSRPPWAYRDQVHLTGRGYRALGRLLTEAILSEYQAYLKARPRLKLTLPLLDAKSRRDDVDAMRQWPSGVTPVSLHDPGKRALQRFFRSLVLLGRKVPRARAKVLYLGDSHAAGDHLTGELRRRLQLLFGDAGHGFVHAAKPWNGYRRTGLRVGAAGPWSYYYLMTRSQAEQPGDQIYGLGGITSWITLPVPPPPPPGPGDGGVRP